MSILLDTGKYQVYYTNIMLEEVQGLQLQREMLVETEILTFLNNFLGLWIINSFLGV